jgi:hypothetical protein
VTSRNDCPEARRRLDVVRAAYVQWLDDLEPTHEMTFNFNRSATMEDAHGRLKKYCCMIERKAFGRKWHKKVIPPDQRLILIAFPEHLDTNTHFHGFACAPDKLGRAVKLSSVKFWEKVVPGGQYYSVPIEDWLAVKTYHTKALIIPGHAEEIFLWARGGGSVVEPVSDSSTPHP